MTTYEPVILTNGVSGVTRNNIPGGPTNALTEFMSGGMPGFVTDTVWY